MKIDINTEPRVKACDALKFVDLCDRQHIVIIGIEGGIISGSKFIPDLDLIADLSRRGDLSWSKFRKKCNQGAASFLLGTGLPRNLVFVMTIIDRQGFNALYQDK